MGNVCASDNKHSKGDDKPSQQPGAKPARVPKPVDPMPFETHFGAAIVPASLYPQHLRVYAPKQPIDAGTFEERFLGVREVSRDGNCFYAAFIYGASEFIAANPADARSDAIVDAFRSADDAVRVRHRVDLVPLFALFQTARDGPAALSAALPAFIQGGLYDAIKFLRLALADRLRAHADDVTPFLPDAYAGDLEGFLEGEVLRMDVSADSLQIYHLSALFPFGVRVTRVDGLREESFPDGLAPDAPAVRLLHTPGHFELLYAR